MQITINIPKDLEQKLIQQATQLNIPLESFILQSLRQLTQTTQSKVACWSDTILSYKGDPEAKLPVGQILSLAIKVILTFQHLNLTVMNFYHPANRSCSNALPA